MIEDKIAVGAEQVVRHKHSIVRGQENLAVKLEQSAADGAGKPEVIECVEFIDEHKRGLVHALKPEIQELERVSAGRGNRMEFHRSAVYIAKQILIAFFRSDELKPLLAHLVEERREILGKIVLNDILIKIGTMRVKSDKGRLVKPLEPQHCADEFQQSQYAVIFRQGIGKQDIVYYGRAVRILLESSPHGFFHRK